MAREHTVAEALVFQRAGCAAMGSDLYARVLDGLAADHAAGGVTAELLEGRSARPIHDAIPLRLLGAVHRLVLEGKAPELAPFYPSVGGEQAGDPTPAFLVTVVAHRAEVEAGLARGVQTNEVGRAAVLASGFALVARRSSRPLRLLEVGSSAGLLLRWDRYRYLAGSTELGDPSSPLVFDDVWVDPPPDLTGPVTVAERRGCDIAPIDALTDDGRLTLLSFVWPDDAARFSRLRTALTLARATPVTIDQVDAGRWVEEELAERRVGVVTVVFHSIVLQYLPTESRHRMRDALERAGACASEAAPLAWLRMEPAGEVADLRLTSWPDGAEELLATAGYHGGSIRWSGPLSSTGTTG
jgi:hypothetical protein